MSGGQGFQFTPFGITALGDASGAVGDEMVPADARAFNVPEREIVEHAPIPQLPPAPVRQPATFQLGPGGVVKAAKARAKEIRAELKRLKALSKELEELERLITAAKRPVAAVRAIESARRAR